MNYYIKFAFSKDSELTPYLQDKINEQLSSLLTDDTSVYYELLTKYFETEIAKKTVEILPQWLASILKSLAGVGILFLLTTVVSRVQIRRKTAELQNELKGRQRAEVERLKALQEMNNIMEAVSDIIFTLDLEGRFVNWNKSVEDKTGYTKDELKDKVALELVHSNDRESATGAIMETYKKIMPPGN